MALKEINEHSSEDFDKAMTWSIGIWFSLFVFVLIII